MIKRNIAQCLECNDIIESKYRHDFVQCSCGNIFVDGGTDYIRSGARNISTFKPLTEEDLNSG
jgi:hypothetical protein